jgi:hypothetical protein
VHTIHAYIKNINRYALKFDQTALVFGMLANIFAAFKGNENSKLMKDLKGAPTETYKRYGGVGNQFAVTTVLRRGWGFFFFFLSSLIF